MESHERRKPCGNCPFRREAPLAYWHRSMYEMLSSNDRCEGEYGRARVFGCHKDRSKPEAQKEYCVGWLLNQRERGVPNIALRISLVSGKNKDAAIAQLDECEPDGEMYETVAELVEANLERDDLLREHFPERFKDEY